MRHAKWVLFAFSIISGCRMLPRSGPEITAHRGASYDAPENTLAAVQLAWERGADSVEVDVYLSRDGRIVAIHDKDTKRVAGVDRKVADQTLEELQTLDVGAWKNDMWKGESIPTLEEILTTIPRWRRMFVEIKCGPEIVEPLRTVVNDSGKAARQIAFISFNADVCAELKKEMPRHKVYFLSGFKQNEETGRWTPTVEELIAEAQSLGVDGLDVQCSEPVDKAFVEKVKAAGLSCYVWTVDDPDDARRMVAIGMDGITTNRPDFLREALK